MDDDVLLMEKPPPPPPLLSGRLLFRDNDDKGRRVGIEGGSAERCFRIGARSVCCS